MKTAYVHPVLCTFAVAAWLLPTCQAHDEALAIKPTADEVVRRMLEMDQSRTAALKQYRSERLYVADNPRFSKHAEASVQEIYAAGGKRAFKILSETGSPLIQHKVFDKLLEAEIDAARDENRQQTHVGPQNYQFRLVGAEIMEGRSCYVLQVTPKSQKKYLMRGRVWVDDTDYAIVRMEGSPAENPSLWTRRVHFVRRYEKHGLFWLPASVESESELLVVGKSTLRIEYSEYRIEAADDAPGGAVEPSPIEAVDERPQH